MIDSPVEKNKDYIIDIDNLGYEGEGVGRVNGFTVFVPGALPGEKVEAKVVKTGKSFAYGRLMKVIKQSVYAGDKSEFVSKRKGHF